MAPVKINKKDNRSYYYKTAQYQFLIHNATKVTYKTPFATWLLLNYLY